MLKAVCQNTLPFHSHRKITTRFDGGSLTSDAGWLLFGSLDRHNIDCARASVRVLRKVETDATFVMTC